VTHPVLGTAWWDEGANFLAFHTVHYLAVVVVIAGLTRWVLWRRARHPEGAADPERTSLLGIESTVWVRYLVVGLILGAAWVWQEGESPWAHALRVAILLVFVAPVVRWVRQRYATKRGRGPGIGVPVRGWLLAKLVLVSIALAIEVLLEQWLSLSAATEIAALCLAVTVAVAGPLLHGWLMARERRPLAGSHLRRRRPDVREGQSSP
jgi:hypothetical protein